jgi:hypothetical protein
MKICLFFITTIIAFTACKNEDVKKKGSQVSVNDTTKFTNIKWIDSLKDIGFVEPGKKTEINFKFKNTGTRPLFIISAEPGCGCTVADYPKGAILPGAEGVITAAYNVTSGTTGAFRKNIHVTTNTIGSTSHYVYFYGAIKTAGDTTTTRRKIDTAVLNTLKSKELKRNLLLKPTKN